MKKGAIQAACLHHALYKELPAGARYMYLNFLRVDSKDVVQTEAKFCCSCNGTVH